MAGNPTIRIAILANARRAIATINATTAQLRALSRQARDGQRHIGAFASKLSAVGKAADIARKGVARTGKALGVSLLGFIAAGVTAGSVQLTSAVTAAVGKAAPAIGVLPGLFLAAASAAGTFIVATNGVSDAIEAGFAAALTGSKNDIKKFNESLKSLAPNARATVKALTGLAPELIGIRNAMANKLFAGFAAQIRALGRTYLPLASGHGQRMAAAMNRSALAFARFMRQASTVKSVSSIFTNIRRSADNVTGVLPALGRAFVPLARVSSSFLPQLSKGLTGVVDKLADFIQKSADSGELGKVIQAGLATLKQLFGVLGSIASIAKSIFIDAHQQAGTLFATLGQVLKRVADFLNTDTGMKAVGAVWRTIGEIAKALGDALSVVLPAIGRMLVAIAPTVAVVARAFSDFLIAVTPIVPLIGRLANTIGQSIARTLPTLAPVLVQLAGLFVALVDAIAPLVPVAGEIAIALGRALVSAVQTLLPTLRPLINSIGAAFTSIVAAVGPVVPVLAKAFASIIAAATPLVAPLATIATTVVTALMPALSELLPIVADIATQLGGVLGSVLTALGPSLGTIAASIGTAFADVLKALAPTFAQLAPIVGQLATTLGQSLAQVLTALAPVLPQIASGLAAVAPAVAAILKAATPLLPVIAGIATALANVLTPIVGPLVTGFVALVAAVKIYTATTAAVSAVTTAWNSGMGLSIVLARGMQAQMLLTAGAQRIAAAAQGLWNAAMNSTIVTSLRVGIALAAQRVATIASAVAQGIATVAQWALNIAMMANPIGLIIVAVIALAAVFVVLWRRSETFRNAIMALWDGIKWVGRGIGNFFAGLGRWFWNIGGDIARGIWTGLQAAWGWVREQWGKLIDLLPNWAKKILGIASPSKVMAQIGRNVTTGLAQGIRRDVPKVTRAMSKVSSVVTSGVESPRLSLTANAASVQIDGIAASAAGAPTTINLTVNVPSSVNPADVGRNIVSHIRAYERQLGRQIITAR